MLIFGGGRINGRLTLGMHNGLMPEPPRWLNHMLAILGAPTARFAVAEALASRDAHAAAFPLFVQAAQAGLPPAQYRLGGVTC